MRRLSEETVPVDADGTYQAPPRRRMDVDGHINFRTPRELQRRMMEQGIVKNTTQQRIIEEALDMWFLAKGLGSIEPILKEWKEKRRKVS